MSKVENQCCTVTGLVRLRDNFSNLSNMIGTLIKILKRRFFTLYTGSRLWFCKIIPEAACFKLILAYFPCSQLEVGISNVKPTFFNIESFRFVALVKKIKYIHSLLQLKIYDFSRKNPEQNKKFLCFLWNSIIKCIFLLRYCKLWA